MSTITRVNLTADEIVSLENSQGDPYSGYVWVCDMPGWSGVNMLETFGTPRPLVGRDTDQQRFVVLAAPGSLAHSNTAYYEDLDAERVSGNLANYAEAGWRGREVSAEEFTQLILLPYNQNSANSNRIYRANVRQYSGSDPETMLVKVARDGCWLAIPMPEDGTEPEFSQNRSHHATNDDVRLIGIWESTEINDDDDPDPWAELDADDPVSAPASDRDDMVAALQREVETAQGQQRQAQEELAAFKRQVRAAVIREGKRRNWCSEADTWLLELGLPARQTQYRARATYQIVVEYDVRAETTEEAAQLIRSSVRTRLSASVLNASAATGTYAQVTLPEITVTDPTDTTTTDPVF